MRFAGNQTRFFHEFWEFSGEIQLGIFGNSRFSRRFPGSSRRSRKTRKSGIRSSWIRSCCSRGSRTWSRSWKTGSDPRMSEPGIPRRWRWEFPKKVPGKKFPKISPAVLGTDTEGQSGAGIPRAGKSGNGVAFPKFSGSGVSRCFPAFPERLFPVFSHIPEGFFPVFSPHSKGFFPHGLVGAALSRIPTSPKSQHCSQIFPGIFPTNPFPSGIPGFSLSTPSFPRDSRAPVCPFPIPNSWQEKSKRLELELDEERSSVELLTERVNRSRDQVNVGNFGNSHPRKSWILWEFQPRGLTPPLETPVPAFLKFSLGFLLFGGLWDHRFPRGREFWDALDPGVSG